MMKITQTMTYEQTTLKQALALKQALKEFHETSPFKTGIDWEFKYLWATMTDEQAFAFILKHPEYENIFKKEKDYGTTQA